MAAPIFGIKARQILDSRGYPTVEVDAWVSGGDTGRSSVPSGASTGSREAMELRDGNDKYYRGKSVLLAIDNIEKVLTPRLIGKEATDQVLIDNLMCECDGTHFKTQLGANAILAVSLAVCAGSSGQGRRFPVSLLEGQVQRPLFQ